MADDMHLPPFPAPLRWEQPPASWEHTADGRLTISAGPRTDLFISPQGEPPVLNAPRLLGPLRGDFQLAARVTVDFQATFDAGTLLVWRDERTWAKLCFEYSPQGQPMIVSVVTRGTSDDANSAVVDGRSVWLRVSRIGPAFAFHASRDGSRWDLVRHFAIDAGDTPLVGFVAQSPTGAGCTASFEALRLSGERLADIRSGE